MNKKEELFYPPQNFAGLSSPYSDFEASKVVILPVPYDGTTEWHSGTREGPQAIIDASPFLELYDIELDQEIHKIGINTMPAVQPVLGSIEDTLHRVYTIASELIEKDKFIVMLGGEHSLSLGIVKALKEKYDDLSVLQLDAHADLRDEYLGTKYNNACVMRRALEYCPITQVGIRSLSQEEQQFLSRHNMKPFYRSSQPLELAELPQIIKSLSNNVYISIDLDVFDPSIMSAVGTPEPGGMQWHETMTMLKAIAKQKRIVGFDVMELCPSEGQSACAYMAAKLAYKLIGYCLLQSK
jgi:agmatinase